MNRKPEQNSLKPSPWGLFLGPEPSLFKTSSPPSHIFFLFSKNLSIKSFLVFIFSSLTITESFPCGPVPPFSTSHNFIFPQRNKMNTAKVKQRLKEPTTYLGLALIGQVFGINELLPLANPEIVTGILALLGVILPEAPSAPPEPPTQA